MYFTYKDQTKHLIMVEFKTKAKPDLQNIQSLFQNTVFLLQQ